MPFGSVNFGAGVDEQGRALYLARARRVNPRAAFLDHRPRAAADPHTGPRQANSGSTYIFTPARAKAASAAHPELFVNW
jgi:hypothetical protein